MTHHASGNGALRAPVRNHYFYGKLLDVRHFEMEQWYGIEQRRLLNRLGVGAGVLCGLEVTATAEGQLQIEPGVALDGLGREIVVPAAYCIQDPAQPTDDLGKPDGDPLTEGQVTVCLAYHECETEPAPVLVGDCDTEQSCAPSKVMERYRILVREGLPEARPGSLSPEACEAIFPESPPADHDTRIAACQTISASCDPGDDCVVLATATLPTATDPLTVDDCTYRPEVYSNTTLLDLILCLAGRVAECCVARILRYVSGDAQQGPPSQALTEPLVVELVDGESNVVQGETVTFRIQGGAGSVGDGTTTGVTLDVGTGPDGRASAFWTLGPGSGLNTVEAGVAGGSRVMFHATGIEPAVATPPVVRTIWPANESVLEPDDGGDGTRWFEGPRSGPRMVAMALPASCRPDASR
jgi:hypothetical protein